MGAFLCGMGAGGGAALMEGCASDDTIVHPPPDGSVDGSKPDTGSDTGVDGGSDANILDSTTHFDVGPPDLNSYVYQVTRLYCLKAQTCCGEDVFDVDKCIQLYMKFPARVRWRPALAPYLDGGNMQLVMGPAQKCFDDINQLSCGQGGGSNTLQQTYSDCVAGAVGKLAVGATGCKGSPNVVPTAMRAGRWRSGRRHDLGVCRANGTTGQQCPFGNYGPDGNEKPGSPAFFTIAGFMRLPAERSPDYCANYDTNYGYNTSTTTCQPRAHVTPTPGATCMWSATRFTAKGLPWTGTLTSSIRAIARTAPSSARPPFARQR